MRGGYCAALLSAACVSINIGVTDADIARADTPKWGPHIDFEGRWGESRALGDIGLFAPLWQNWDSLLFTDLRFKFDDADSLEGNFGLGFRHMLPSGWNLGVYGYYDRRRTGSGSTFNQLTLGIEALSVDWDLRANAYLPFGDRLQSLGFVTPAPFAELASGTIEVVTPATSERLERALTGFDAEVGWRVPLLPVESHAQIRAYAGGFWFDGAGLIDDIYGPRGRIEVSFDEPLGLPGARFTLGAEAQHDQVRGAQGYAMARLRLPLQAPERVAPPLTPQERRMTERVVRDVDVVTGTQTEQRTSEVRETAVNVYNNETVTAVAQVDAAQGQTALQDAIDDLGTGGVVILNGALTGLTQSTQLTAGGTLIGGGTALPVRGANTGMTVNFIAPGTQGALGGPIAPDLNNISATVRLAPNSVLGGLDIANAYTAAAASHAGVLGDAAPGATVFANRITTAADAAIGLAFLNASDDARALGNTIENNGTNGIGIGVGGSDRVLVAENEISADDSGILFLDSHFGTARGNRIAGGGSILTGSIGFLFSDNGTAIGNEIVTKKDSPPGIVFHAAVNGTAIGNRIVTSGANAEGIRFVDTDNAIASGNEITTTGTGATGIVFDASSGVLASGNRISTGGEDAHGIHFAASANGIASGNSVETMGDDAYGIYFENSADGTASGNSIRTSGSNGAALLFEGSSSGTASNNDIMTAGPSGLGIHFLDSDGGAATNNRITTFGSIGIGILASNSDGGTIDGNTISTAGMLAGGIVFAAADSWTAAGNTITAAGERGYGLMVLGGTNLTVNGNTIATTGADAYGLVVSTGTDVTVSNNHFGMIATNVIFAEFNSHFTAGSTGNTWTGQGGSLCGGDTSTMGSIQFTDTGKGVPGSCP